MGNVAVAWQMEAAEAKRRGRPVISLHNRCEMGGGVWWWGRRLVAVVGSRRSWFKSVLSVCVDPYPSLTLRTFNDPPPSPPALHAPRLLWAMAAQAGITAAVWAGFGGAAAAVHVGAACMAQAYLSVIDYILHYGLERVSCMCWAACTLVCCSPGEAAVR